MWSLHLVQTAQYFFFGSKQQKENPVQNENKSIAVMSAGSLHSDFWSGNNKEVFCLWVKCIHDQYSVPVFETSLDMDQYAARIRSKDPDIEPKSIQNS